MAKVISGTVTKLRTYAWKGMKDGAIGGLATGMTGLILGPQLGGIIGGAVGAAITKNPQVALNGVMDAVNSFFLAAGAS